MAFRKWKCFQHPRIRSNSAHTPTNVRTRWGAYMFLVQHFLQIWREKCACASECVPVKRYCVRCARTLLISLHWIFKYYRVKSSNKQEHRIFVAHKLCVALYNFLGECAVTDCSHTLDSTTVLLNWGTSTKQFQIFRTNTLGQLADLSPNGRNFHIFLHSTGNDKNMLQMTRFLQTIRNGQSINALNANKNQKYSMNINNSKWQIISESCWNNAGDWQWRSVEWIRIEIIWLD